MSLAPEPYAPAVAHHPAQHTEPPENAIEITGLRKTYPARDGAPAVTALDGVDLRIPRGSIYGLLGPNGAGKSTMINIMSGLTVKSGGTVRIWRHDIDTEPRGVRASIGIVPQELLMDPFFTPRQALELQAGLFGVPRRERHTDEILGALGLLDKADAYARSLSGGMRRRLMVAKALVHSPPILVLDEPTAGVDVELRRQLWAYVRTLNARGCTILLTTHYLEEAQTMCDRIAIINRGRVVANDTTEGLLGLLDLKTLRMRLTRDPDPMPAALSALGIERIGQHRVHLHYRPSTTPLAPILEAVQAAGFEILDLTSEEGDLEDVFLELTGPSSKT
jgi:ABC-2 type transport system ATP-binding protein